MIVSPSRVKFGLEARILEVGFFIAKGGVTPGFMVMVVRNDGYRRQAKRHRMLWMEE